mmetsp:Transcript_17913/g.71779  ORF Transcript_17913/g.71779 Transcript_17913/m.71779 type:complete len:90 (-) Transcript_17913:578-847(-)
MKRDAFGQIERYKARLVVQGYTQGGDSYDQIFAPTINFESIRIMLVLAAKYDWDIRQPDIRTAYLYGERHDDVYVEPPESYGAKTGAGM